MRTRKPVRRRMAADALQWAQRLWTALDTPVSLSCTIMARYGEFEQLVRKSVDPRVYNSPLRFYLDYQAVKLLSKYPYLKTGINRRREATVKFLEAEVQCALTNDRFHDRDISLRIFDPSGSVGRVFYRAQRKIATILGPVPSLEELDFRFGPGANYGVRGDTSVYSKLASPLECTFALTQILPEFLGEFPGWLPEGVHTVELCAGSELTFVPKDAKIDRPICIEPLLNGLYQKGFGSYIRKRLQRHGVELRDQSINQRLSRLAWTEGLYTVDFASASDTIAYGLVLDLLPFPWFEALEVARSPSYKVDECWYDFHKFTSMGNAYTFELETLIFYALAASSCEEVGVPYYTGLNLHVYGDDVVIPGKAFSLFQEVCTFAGFSINESKSFGTGVFHESCGTDWYRGHNVRPYQLKRRLTTVQDIYYAANVTLLIAERIAALAGRDEHPLHGRVDDDTVHSVVNRVRDVHAWCVGCIPRKERHVVPEGFGHVGLFGDFDVARPQRCSEEERRRGWDGYWVRGYIPRHPRVSLDEYPMAYILYHAGSTTGSWWDVQSVTHSSGYTPREKEEPRYVRRKLYVLGDWDRRPIQWNDRALSLVENTR